jgi:aryl-alcohol dehydrogenase-like predicted oxidoreductase
MSTDGKNPKELMEYRNLGRTGLRVSLLSFGAWVKFFKKNNNFFYRIIIFL